MLTLFGVTLDKKQLGLIVLFTIVEIVTLVVWLILAATPAALAVSTGRAVIAIVVLAVGLLIEHAISTAAGKA